MRTSNTKTIKIFRITATFLVAFLFSFLVSSLTSPTKNSSALDCSNSTSTDSSSICSTDTTDVNVSVSGSWTISVSSAGTLSLDIAPTSTGTLSTVVDNVNIYTNTPNGYQLYLNSTTNSTDIYNTNDTEQALNHFTSTTGTKESPVSLTNNTWGYSLDTSPTTFSKVELTNTSIDSLISTGSKTTGAGDNLPITYGFKADTGLTPGTYATQVTYTVVADAPSYTLTSVSPLGPTYNAPTTEVTIMTSAPSTELGLGDITATIGTVSLTNCTEIISNGYRGTTCTYPGGLPAGRYNVALTSSWHNSTYTLTNAFTINSMQEFTSANCVNLAESTTTVDNRIDLVDSRDGKTYKVSKLADGNCWMVSNLALNGGITLTPSDSDVTENRTLPSNISNGTAVSYTTAQIYAGYATSTTTKCNYAYCVTNSTPYGNAYNWTAATATTIEDNYTKTATDTVCPKNWTLPDNGDSDKSWNALLSAYSLPTTNSSNQGASIQKLQKAPFYFVLSGRYEGSPVHQGHYGSYLSRNMYRQGMVSYFNMNSENGAFWPHNASPSANGYSIRCIFNP